MNAGNVSHVRHDSSIEMLKEDKLEQTLNALVENLDLDAIDLTELDLIIQNSYEAGEHFTHFLKTTGQSIVDRRTSRTIKINRHRLFDPVQFVHDQALEIEEQDERSVMLKEIDPYAIALESMLRDETVISGEEHLKRLNQTGYIRLDARVFQTLWENQRHIPEHWKGAMGTPQYIFFDGTVLSNPLGRYVMCMYWAEDQRWRWTYCRTNVGGWKSEDRSAVLKV